jgi:glycosyltransferase involved in cell wall biosynthesis
MQELVSIALCTYNPGKFLIPLLESLVGQDWRPLEIVCCDDGSTDDTLNILHDFSSKYPGLFHIHVNESNLGYIKNFEKCLGLCHGNYIAIADHDDIWISSKITELYGAIGDSLMVYSDSWLIDEEGISQDKKLSDIFRLHDKPSPEAFAFYDFVWGHTCLLKKELLKLALPIPAGMPYDTWLAYTAAAVSSVRYVNKPLTKWRQHPGAFSSRMFEENLTRRNSSNWKFEEYLSKKNRIGLFLQSKYGDHEFMKELYENYSFVEKGFSWKLFFFLVKHQRKLFPVWRRNYISRLNEFHKMARMVSNKS